MEKIILLALAGACGAISRFWLTSWTSSLLGLNFPWGTWLVNIAGCFLFGLIWVLAYEKGLIPVHLRVVILVGFLGSFTTFSTYIFENSAFIQDAQWVKIVLNILGQNILGFCALYLGYLAARGV